LLTRAGDDDVALVGDLDLTDSVTVQGAGAGLTIVDGNGAVTGDRVFDIQPGAVETSLNGMTIRNGQRNGTFDTGGGLRWQGGGGHAHLAGLILEDNHAAYLAGLDAEFAPRGGALELDTVVVRNNVATAAGAGVGASFPPGRDQLHDAKHPGVWQLGL
jgi:hypothetical protein